ncbi:ribosomal L1 domain-containing protein 1-like [Cloeon dipterum]|uniref:ribosomal L1 domain-containing protein 1-like n=1 Tax=Cloeon dipterum TaxID=197152 RepID=UPI0032208281
MKVRKSMSKPRASLALQKPKSIENSPIKGGNKKKLKNPAGVVYPPENLVEPDLEQETIEKAAEALLKLDADRKENKISLLGGDAGEPVNLLFSFYKIAEIPSRMLRFEVPNSPVQDSTDIALIVRDLEPKRREPDHDVVIQMYESRLRAHGIKHPLKIITLRQIMTECKTYEAKKKLCNSYDMFLADCSISGTLVPLLGKHFSTVKKNPVPVKTEPIGLMKSSIEKAFRKVQFQLNSNGNCKSIKIGHTKMEASQIAENVVAAAKALCKELPGGWINIRNMQIKTLRAPGVTFYHAIRNPNDVKITGIRKTIKHNKAVEGELSTTTMDDFKVRVRPDGEVEMIDLEGKRLSKKRTLEAMKEFGFKRKRKYAVSDAVILASEEADDPEENEEEESERVVPNSTDRDADMDAEHGSEDEDVKEELQPKKEKGTKKKKKAKVVDSDDDDEEEAAVGNYEEAYLHQLEQETKEKKKNVKKTAKKAQDVSNQVEKKKKGQKASKAVDQKKTNAANKEKLNKKKKKNSV